MIEDRSLPQMGACPGGRDFRCYAPYEAVQCETNRYDHERCPLGLPRRLTNAATLCEDADVAATEVAARTES